MKYKNSSTFALNQLISKSKWYQEFRRRKNQKIKIII